MSPVTRPACASESRAKLLKPVLLSVMTFRSGADPVVVAAELVVPHLHQEVHAAGQRVEVFLRLRDLVADRHVNSWRPWPLMVASRCVPHGFHWRSRFSWMKPFGSIECFTQ